LIVAVVLIAAISAMGKRDVHWIVAVALVADSAISYDWLRKAR
jgi:hypothetical protein